MCKLTLHFILKRGLFFIAVLYLIISPVNAQEISLENKKRVAVKVSPIALLGDGITNSIIYKAGVEFPILKSVFASSDIGFYNQTRRFNNGFANVDVLRIRGITTSLELKKYFNNDTLPMGPYVSGQLIYTYTTARRNQEFIFSNGCSCEKYYTIWRYMIAMHAKIGYQLLIGKGLIIDVGAGLGVRYISSESFFRDGMDVDVREPLYSKIYQHGSRWFPSTTFSMKIGWLF